MSITIHVEGVGMRTVTTALERIEEYERQIESFASIIRARQAEIGECKRQAGRDRQAR